MFFLGSDTDVVKSVFVLLRGRTDRVKLVLVFSRVHRSLPEGSRGHTDVVKSDSKGHFCGIRMGYTNCVFGFQGSLLWYQDGVKSDLVLF